MMAKLAIRVWECLHPHLGAKQINDAAPSSRFTGTEGARPGSREVGAPAPLHTALSAPPRCCPSGGPRRRASRAARVPSLVGRARSARAAPGSAVPHPAAAAPPLPGS